MLAPGHHASADFNGDGYSDVLLRDFRGSTLSLYGDQSGGLTAGLTLNWSPTSTIDGFGDFNGDGREDILLTGQTNVNGTLLISGLQTISAGFQPDWEAALTMPVGWSVAGTADFNGDGKTDVLLRNESGTITDWLIGPHDSTIVDVPNAPFIPNAVFSISVPTDWQVVGTGDFNGDGYGDILWRSDGGIVRDWLGQADGGFHGNVANLNITVPTDWAIATTGDYNGDGYSDILWRNVDGTLHDWLGQANGGFVGNLANLNFNPGADFQVQPNPSGAGLWDY